MTKQSLKEELPYKPQLSLLTLSQRWSMPLLELGVAPRREPPVESVPASPLDWTAELALLKQSERLVVRWLVPRREE